MYFACGYSGEQDALGKEDDDFVKFEQNAKQNDETLYERLTEPKYWDEQAEGQPIRIRLRNMTAEANLELKSMLGFSTLQEALLRNQNEAYKNVPKKDPR